jgi:predicted metal-dependent hydrolase
VVDVPQATTDAAVQAAVHRRARWISGQVAAVRERFAHASLRAHISGESLFCRGRRFVLKVLVDGGRDGHVRLRGTRIEVAVVMAMLPACGRCSMPGTAGAPARC